MQKTYQRVAFKNANEFRRFLTKFNISHSCDSAIGFRLNGLGVAKYIWRNEKVILRCESNPLTGQYTNDDGKELESLSKGVCLNLDVISEDAEHFKKITECLEIWGKVSIPLFERIKRFKGVE